MKRFRARKNKDKRIFSKTASKVAKKNFIGGSMRGGYRI